MPWNLKVVAAIFVIFNVFFITKRASSQEISESQKDLFRKNNVITPSQNISSNLMALLLYEKNNDGYISKINDNQSLSSSGGNYDIDSELKSLIQILSHENKYEHKDTICRFPARISFLNQTLGLEDFDYTELCQWYDVRKNIEKTDSVTLVYTEPSQREAGAMFGHVFLRFNQRDVPSLLSPSISYAAYIRGMGLAKTFWRGLFGKFDGYFSLKPYYSKLNEYNEIEDRDIWEYHLNLTPNQAKLLALHAVELNGMKSNYNFLDRNCGYEIVKMIESVKSQPEIDNFSFIKRYTATIPSEVVKSLWEHGIIANFEYKPSIATKIIFARKKSSHTERIHALSLLSNIETTETKPLSPVSAFLALETLKYKFSKLLITQEEFTDKFLEIKKRSSIENSIEVPHPTPPHVGHKPSRISLSYGLTKKNHYIETALRPVHHETEDPPNGYPAGSELSFLAFALRLIPETNTSTIHYIDAIKIKSLNPSNEFIKSRSIYLYAGANREYKKNNLSQLTPQCILGLGNTMSYGTRNILYALGSASVISKNNTTNSIKIGPEVEIGTNFSFNDTIFGSIKGVVSYYPSGSKNFFSRQKFTIGLRTSQNITISFNASSYQHSNNIVDNELSSSLMLYF